MRQQAFLVLWLAAFGVPGCFWLDITTKSDYGTPRVSNEDGLSDDRLEDRPALAFDAERVDRRPLGDWQLNASAAVFKLDVPAVKPDVETSLLKLYPSYAAAVAAVKNETNGAELLPSVNLIDGKAKQFDDGLYAAIDRAYYLGFEQRLRSHVELIRRFFNALDKKSSQDSQAVAYLAAGLELAGIYVAGADENRKAEYLREFQANPVASRPVGVYTWNQELARCFRFLRFFQREFSELELEVPFILAAVLDRDPSLRDDYRKMVEFYGKLTNPRICRSLLDVSAAVAAGKPPLSREATRGTHKTVALLPPSTSRETVLFEKLFPESIPPDIELMQALIDAIRSGRVNLAPTPDSGWYDYQVHALETMLLPGKGEENGKLLLTKTYKKRMLEAFKALITKRRETHVRQLAPAVALATARPPMGASLPTVKPRLRLEPCPTFYLRTARAYSFLGNLLQASIGEAGLRSLHGMRKEGERELDLATELHWMKDLFYGCYLISAEDIGLKPALASGEVDDAERCYRVASEWLPKAFNDRDLAADTRVVVTVAVDRTRKVTRVWATLGVRLAKLDAEYARPPSLRYGQSGPWQQVEGSRLEKANYLIAVDEFAEVELSGNRALTREEFREICNRGQTKEGILALLRARR